MGDKKRRSFVFNIISRILYKFWNSLFIRNTTLFCTFTSTLQLLAVKIKSVVNYDRVKPSEPHFPLPTFLLDFFLPLAFRHHRRGNSALKSQCFY